MVPSYAADGGRERCQDIAVAEIQDSAGSATLVCWDHYVAMVAERARYEAQGFIFKLAPERLGPALARCQMVRSTVQGPTTLE
jgi:hypothetical protein